MNTAVKNRYKHLPKIWEDPIQKAKGGCLMLLTPLSFGMAMNLHQEMYFVLHSFLIYLMADDLLSTEKKESRCAGDDQSIQWISQMVRAMSRLVTTTTTGIFIIAANILAKWVSNILHKNVEIQRTKARLQKEIPRPQLNIKKFSPTTSIPLIIHKCFLLDVNNNMDDIVNQLDYISFDLPKNLDINFLVVGWMACAEKTVLLSFCPSLVHRLLLSKAQNVPFRIVQSLHKAVVIAQNEGQFAMAHVLRPKVYFFPRDAMMDGYGNKSFF
ncbi:hypothetical protein E3N88_18499 [Mikania micrantha]|uniref:Uncharacterized protein n=1 Tax=Mikania micrantha TaxID=192012 RepID=A0A5N6NME4_9ASTR|nr:hypothetical protein E3N88_18499 [Mikania micrantha]